MPKKQNGFGNSRAFKGINTSINKGKVKGAAGLYPSNRGYGSSVTRTVIEKYDLDSDWTRWRRGVEYYYQGSAEAIYELDSSGKVVIDANGDKVIAEIISKLYQDTPDEMDVKFTGYRFPTLNSDSRNHYVYKRNNVNPPNLGTVTSVQSDPLIYSENKARGELWIQTSNTNSILKRMLADRITDGETEATILYVLDSQKRPGYYVGKTDVNKLASITVSVPLADVMSTTYIQEHGNNIHALVGQVGYLKSFFVQRATSTEVFTDGNYFFNVSVTEQDTNQDFEILEKSDLPPSLYDIASLTKIFTTSAASYELEGDYKYNKEEYQRFFGKAYLTAQVVEAQVNEVAFTVMPFTINSVLVVGNQLEITSIPFESELQLHSDTSNGYVVFADNSFTKKEIDSYDGNYYHDLGAPGSTQWYRIDSEVDPWMDEVFTSGNALQPADIYCCSCPDFSHAMMRMPESTGENGKSTNKQARYPLPTVMSRSDFDALGMSQVAGMVNSWEDYKYRYSFKVCKHTVAAMFTERLKLKEPNAYPTVDSRLKFEEKLKVDMETVSDKEHASLRRSNLTTLELVYALAQGLNLDEVETAYVVLNNSY